MTQDYAQRELPVHLRALLRQDAYPHPVETVELVETHVSWVLLTGAFAYKIKRPVQYAFIDLRSAERRAFFCREELRLNQRFAAELYLEVCEITSVHGEARIGGTGPVIDHAVRMHQFRREDELDRLLASGRIEARELEAFGRSLAHIHAQLPVAPQARPWGRPDRVRALILENLEQCIEAGARLGDSDGLRALGPRLTQRLEVLTPCLVQRRAADRVRECHGDLHVRNIVRRAGRLLAFDCLEFDPAFRWIDVADEIAFLLADLDVLGHPTHANAFLNGYLAEGGDYQACRVVDLYKAHRALIRAKVTALAYAGQIRSVGREQARRQYEAYVGGARGALASRQPLLVLMMGLSGSGKSWLASRLAPLLGAIHLRSDTERKRLAALPGMAQSASAIQQQRYSPEAKARVYEYLADCAQQVLGGGYAAIIDATFARREDRARFCRLAARLGVRLRVVSCRAAQDVLRARVAERHARGTDASEADLDVLRWQEAHAEPVMADEGLVELEVDTTGNEPAPSIDDLVKALHDGPADAGPGLVGPDAAAR